MNKQQVESLINRLSDKTLSVDCETSIGKIVAVFDTPNSNQMGDKTYHILAEQEKSLMYTIEKYTSEGIKNLEIKGHQIRIGDILAKMRVAEIDDEYHGHEATLDRVILTMWDACTSGKEHVAGVSSFNKSLQEIIEVSGWEEFHYSDTFSGSSEPVTPDSSERLKDPNARALLEELNKLFQDEIPNN